MDHARYLATHPEAIDPQDFLRFLVVTLCLSVPSYYIGTAIENALKGKGTFIKICVNATMLFSVTQVVPWEYYSHFQDTMPGLVASAVIMGVQTWTEPLFPSKFW